jgi:Xaa-Pro aminopeptidase
MRIASPEFLQTRTARLGALLDQHQLDALAVTSLPNIAYLTGFFASAAALLVTRDSMSLVTDGRYDTQVRARANEWPVIRAVVIAPGNSYDQALVDAFEPLRGLRLGFEASHLTVRRFRFITDALSARGWQIPLRETDGIVEQLRATKDEWEIATLRDGALRLSSVAKCILSNSLTGRMESDVAADIEGELRRAGFARPAFDTIVAAGPNAALPHARASSRRIEPDDLVVLDFGGVLDGYCTDLTRTVVAGKGGNRQRRLIDQVVEAQAAAFAAVAPGRSPEQVDQAARDALAGHGLADAFTHGTGHGLGIEVHEAPRVTRWRPEYAEPPLAAGMVMTLEPGAYFPGWGGVRIEDDVLVTEDGAEWLTDVPRTL